MRFRSTVTNVVSHWVQQTRGPGVVRYAAAATAVQISSSYPSEFDQPHWALRYYHVWEQRQHLQEVPEPSEANTQGRIAAPQSERR